MNESKCFCHFDEFEVKDAAARKAIEELQLIKLDGLAVKNIAINDSGHLIITLSNDNQFDLGKVVGRDGVDGKDGVDGANGKDGVDGKDGVGIKKIAITNGNLVITLTSGQIHSLGKVVGEDGVDGVNGKDGEDGVDGVNGKDGEDGVGIESLIVNDSGHLVITLTDGTVSDLGKVVSDVPTIEISDDGYWVVNGVKTDRSVNITIDTVYLHTIVVSFHYADQTTSTNYNMPYGTITIKILNTSPNAFYDWSPLLTDQSTIIELANVLSKPIISTEGYINIQDTPGYNFPIKIFSSFITYTEPELRIYYCPEFGYDNTYINLPLINNGNNLKLRITETVDKL